MSRCITFGPESNGLNGLFLRGKHGLVDILLLFDSELPVDHGSRIPRGSRLLLMLFSEYARMRADPLVSLLKVRARILVRFVRHVVS